MLKSGIFADSLKISKIVPLCKKDDDTNLSNYRPISRYKRCVTLRCVTLMLSKCYSNVI